MTRLTLGVLALVGLCWSLSAQAAPLPLEHVPAPLRAWVPWVSHATSDLRCPPLDKGGRQCEWLASLALDVDASGVSFVARVDLDRPGFVRLPGDSATTVAVLSEGKDKPLVPVWVDGEWRAFVGAGERTLTGRLTWQARPDAMALPDGFAAVTVNGLAEDGYRIDGGRLVLRARGGTGSGAESDAVEVQDGMHVEVQRRVVAGRQTMVETRVLLEVSGRPRMVEVPGALLEGFVLHALDTPLGAEVTGQRALVLEALPGEWDVRVVGRAAPETLRFVPESAQALPDLLAGETWVVSSSALPIAAILGGSPVDPAQTRLPSDWQGERAFRLVPTATLAVTLGQPEEVRGSLTLHRELWLDFAGKELSGREHLSGTLLSENGRGVERLRLNAQAPWVPGRVLLGGVPRLITTDPTSGLPGIEVPSGPFDLVAEMHASLKRPIQAQPVLPWHTEATEATGLIHLPPGFLLLGAKGVVASESWLGAWDLWLAFVWFLSVFLAYKLFGWRVALLALVALGLSLSAAAAPRSVWVWLLAALASLSAVTGLLESRPALGRGLRQAFRFLTLGAALTLVGYLIPFTLSDVKLALFPALESGHAMELTAESMAASSLRGAPAPRRRSAPRADAAAEYEMLATAEMNEDVIAGDSPQAPPHKSTHSQSQQLVRKKLESPPGPAGAGGGASLGDAHQLAAVQTGTGLPLWRWRTHALSWPGPVAASASFRLWLAPPWLVALLRLVRSLLVLALAGHCLHRLARDYRELSPAQNTGTAPLAASLALLAGLLLPASAAGQSEGAGFPSEAMLSELRDRLAAPPDCAPGCAAVAHIQVRANVTHLALEVDIEHAARVVSALPTLGAGGWPERIVTRGNEAIRVTRVDSLLLLEAPAGRHRIRLEGRLDDEVAALNLPYAPRKLTLDLDHVLVEGVRDGLPAGNTLTLRKVAARVEQPGDLAAPGPQRQSVEPFGHVVRTLALTSQWQLSTTLSRENPSSGALHVLLPRLPGETPLNDQVEVLGDALKVTLPAGAGALTFESRIEARPQLSLTRVSSPQVETFWRLRNAGPWQVRAARPGELQAAPGGMLEWTPSAGSTSLDVGISPLAGSPGATTTLTHVKLREHQGATTRRSTLTLSLRSSVGEVFSLPLPKGAVLSHVKRAGEFMATNSSAEGLRLAVPPGEQEVEVEWTAPHVPGFRLRTSALSLPFPTRNVSLALDVGAPRWLLWLQGPGAGPALLFWPTVLLLALLAVVLGRLPLHLTALSWFLLGLGLTQSLPAAGLTLVALFATCLWRRRVELVNPYLFNLRQLLLLWLMLLGLVTLLDALRTGLLGVPKSYVAHVIGGDGASLLEWFSAAQVSSLPQATVLSAPMWCYQLLMFAWALWLATALPSWVRWIGGSIVQDGLIKPLNRRQSSSAPPAT